jgi:transcriptional regulator with XRE-family HTH domain
MARSLEQILATEDPKVVAKAKEQAGKILLEINLSDLRAQVNKTQVEIAGKLGVKQPTVASLEKPGKDLKLSSLKKYVEAAGGKLRLDVELPNGTHYGFAV